MSNSVKLILQSQRVDGFCCTWEKATDSQVMRTSHYFGCYQYEKEFGVLGAKTVLGKFLMVEKKLGY